MSMQSTVVVSPPVTPQAEVRAVLRLLPSSKVVWVQFLGAGSGATGTGTGTDTSAQAEDSFSLMVYVTPGQFAYLCSVLGVVSTSNNNSDTEEIQVVSFSKEVT